MGKWLALFAFLLMFIVTVGKVVHEMDKRIIDLEDNDTNEVLMKEIVNIELRVKGIEDKVADLENTNEKLDSVSGQIREVNKSIEEFMNNVNSEFDKYEIFNFEATGYSPFDDVSGLSSEGDPSVTSTGAYPKDGTIAVNPKIIPYGTKMYVEGYGWGVAEDTGGAMRARNDLIDLYFDTYKQSRSWGRRDVRVLVEKGAINR